MQCEIEAGLVERIFGALNLKFWINTGCKVVISSVLILSLVIQFFSVLSTKAASISGVGFASQKINESNQLVKQVIFHLRDQPLMLSRHKVIWSRQCIATMAAAAALPQVELKHQTKHNTAPKSMLDSWAKAGVAEVET